MAISALILATVLATSILSGVIGMAGGIILMAVLVSVQSVAWAMIVHGAIQATANGSRAFFLRRHIAWHILPGYLLGAALAVGLFAYLALVPDAGLVLLIIGVFPWAARLVRHLRGLDITRRGVPAVCGVAVTAAQLFAGASGPLLDVFYLNSKLDRHAVVASKALTQALGHILKLLYFGVVIGVSEPISPWFLAVAIATAVIGTRIGTLLLARVDEAQFRRVSGWIILGIGTFCILRGAQQLLDAG